MPPLYFLRHGETDWNAEGRLQGQQDIAFNPLGRRQAIRRRADSEENSRRTGVDPAALLWQVSPLSRTRDTMALARAATRPPRRWRAPRRSTERVHLRALGGQDLAGGRGRGPRGAKARDRDKWNFCPPGGESYAELAQRLRPGSTNSVRPPWWSRMAAWPAR